MAIGHGNGYAAPYRPPADPRYAALLAPPPARRTPGLGIAALVLAIAALVLALPGVIVAAHAAADAIAAAHAEGFEGFAWVMLYPVRTLVLVAEIGFCTGSVLGAWAIVQGAVAARANRGRRPAVAAIIIAAAAPLLVALAGVVAFAVGA